MGWDLRIPSLPEGLVAALERELNLGHLRYTWPTTIYSCLQPDYRDLYVGVTGDGANGSYEWFIWIPPGLLRISNCGYGCTGVALCDGLVEAGAQKSTGKSDLVLAWIPGARGFLPHMPAKRCEGDDECEDGKDEFERR